MGIRRAGSWAGRTSRLSPVLERGVLGVGGMPYVLLLPRSADFDQFFTLLKSAYPDQRDIMLLLAVFQNLWDPGEGSGWAWAMNKRAGARWPAKQVLMQVAIGDAQVTNIGAHIQARAFGAKTVAPQTRPVWGVEEQPSGFQGSALRRVELYTDVPDEPVENQCRRRRASTRTSARAASRRRSSSSATSSRTAW
jgi:hypothetical protein